MALKAEEVYAILKKQIQSGGATPEQIQQAVDAYLEENPVQPGATEEQAAQIEKNKSDISLIYDNNNIINKRSLEQTADLSGFENLSIETKVGFYNSSNLNYTSLDSYECTIIEVNPGEIYRVTAYLPNADNLSIGIFTDAEDNIIGLFMPASASNDSTAQNDIMEIPLKCKKVYLTSQSSETRLSIENVSDFVTYDEFSSISKNIKDIYPLFVRQTITNNIVDPMCFVKGFYYDFKDGKTIVKSKMALCTKEKIKIIETVGSLYAIIKEEYAALAPNNIVAIYFYNDDTYLGYETHLFSSLSKTKNVSMISGANYIRIYCNVLKVNYVEGDQPICISYNEIESFENYQYKLVLKYENQEHQESVKTNLSGKVIVNFGDSIFGNKRPPSDISTAISEITGATVYNLGFGGCRMAEHSPNWDAFSMYRLAYSIANNDFSVQDSVDIPSVSGMPSYFEETRELLKSIDFNNVDIITIAYGTNDFTAGIEIESEERLSTETYAGALRYSIEKILSAYPNIKIFICSQTYRFWIGESGDFEDDSDTHVISTKKLTDFVEKTKEVSNEYHLKFIDNYYDLGINKFNRTHWFPENDGTHHNVDGARLIAEHMVSEIF